MKKKIFRAGHLVAKVEEFKGFQKKPTVRVTISSVNNISTPIGAGKGVKRIKSDLTYKEEIKRTGAIFRAERIKQQRAGRASKRKMK